MPTYFEKTTNAKGQASYLFVKRLNPKNGTFPLFKEKVKRKMTATTDAEASREAKTLAAELDLLQEVARKDGKHINSAKDKNKAAQTWTHCIAGIDLQSLKSLRDKHTKEAQEAREILEFVEEEVTCFYETRELDHEGGINSWLTDFGDHLLRFLRDGQGVGTISDEGIKIYLRQTQRDHLDEKVNSVRTVHRVVGYFVEEIGDKQLDQITRKDVERYVTSRLLKVKTTSVQRELRTLSALWNKCAKVLDLRLLNPFSEQPIKGLGTDSTQRHTPTSEETQKLLEVLEAKAAEAPDSYVWPLVAIAALAGTRLSEAWGLCRDDWVKDGFSTLLIRPNTNRKNLKTTNSVRPIPVLEPLAVWLERYFAFVDAKRVPNSANSASASTVKALKRQGFTFGNQSLRHGMKQRLVEVDAPSNVYEELMGWSSQSMAANYGRNQATATKSKFMAAVYQRIGVSVDGQDGDNVVMLRKRIKSSKKYK